MAVGFGMIACYAFGLIAHFFPLLLTPVLGLVAILVSMVCRFYRVGVPGSLFFVMAASIAAYSPTDVMQVPLKVGLLAMGCLLAALIAFVYSVVILRLREPHPIAPLPPGDVRFRGVRLGGDRGRRRPVAGTGAIAATGAALLGAGQLSRGDPGPVDARGVDPAGPPRARHRAGAAAGRGAAGAAAGKMEHLAIGDRAQSSSSRAPWCGTTALR